MKTFNLYDKSGWDDGEWKKEADLAIWHENTAYPCMIIRTEMGTLCGYAGVGPAHPFYGRGYSDCSLPGAKPRGPKPEDKEPLVLEEGKITIPPPPARLIEGMEKLLVCSEGEYCSHTPSAILSAHGGITFGSQFKRHPEIAKHDEFFDHYEQFFLQKEIWFFGFDCAHAWDFIPRRYGDAPPEFYAMMKNKYGDATRFTKDVYRTMEYVKAETENLRQQLMEIPGERVPQRPPAKNDERNGK